MTRSLQKEPIQIGRECVNVTPSATAALQDETPVLDSTVPQVFSLPQAQSRVRVVVHKSPWIEHLKERFDVITSLKTGWDGYEGKSVAFEHAVFAANLIDRLYTDDVPPPEIVPGSDGTLQIEWHRRGLSVELDVLEPYQVLATKITRDSGQIEEHTLDSEFSLVADWIKQLK